MLGATGALDVGLRAEVRGLEGGPPGATLVEPVPYQIEPSFELAGQLDPRLSYAVALLPRLLLLADPAGGRAVHSSSEYVFASATLTWLADARTTLRLSGSGSRGTLAMSPLTQLTSSLAAAGGAAPADAGLLDPAAGIRTGEFSSGRLRAACDWRATPALTLGVGADAGRSGGLGLVGLRLFPAVETMAADAHATLAVTPRDGLGVQAGYTRTYLVHQGTVGILDALARWTRRLAPDLDGTLGAGIAATVQSTPAATPHPASRDLVARAEASIAATPPTDGRGLGFRALLGYAPYVDQFAGEVLQRFTGNLDVDWLIDARHRISWSASGARALGDGGAALGVVAAELGGWYRREELELGLTLRGGRQEGQVPGSAVHQWSIGVVTRWRQGRVP